MTILNKNLAACFFASVMLSIGCKQNDAINDAKNSEVITSFNLQKDLFDFSDKLAAGDTLTLFADLSICDSWHTEKNIFYKASDKVLTKSWNDGEFVNEDEMELREVHYQYNPNDSLNFETLLKAFELSVKNAENQNSPRIKAIHLNDTIVLHSNDYLHSMRIADYYNKIKSRLYPDLSIYKPVEPILDSQ